MFDPSRDQVRLFFLHSWRKHHQDLPLSDMESLALRLINHHPEYHALLNLPEEEILAREWSPESGVMNPFLHLSLHMALEEQLNLDQPQGIRNLYQNQCRLLGDEHEARHRLLDCLGQMVWEAQRLGTQPDPQRYRELLDAIPQAPH